MMFESRAAAASADINASIDASEDAAGLATLLVDELQQLVDGQVLDLGEDLGRLRRSAQELAEAKAAVAEGMANEDSVAAASCLYEAAVRKVREQRELLESLRLRLAEAEARQRVLVRR